MFNESFLLSRGLQPTIKIFVYGTPFNTPPHYRNHSILHHTSVHHWTLFYSTLHTLLFTLQYTYHNSNILQYITLQHTTAVCIFWPPAGPECLFSLCDDTSGQPTPSQHIVKSGFYRFCRTWLFSDFLPNLSSCPPNFYLWIYKLEITYILMKG